MDLSYRTAPGATALVVVDVQNDFCHPDGVMGTAGNDVSAAVEMVPRLKALIDDARAAGVLVVFIQTTHDETVDSPVWLSRRGPLVEELGDARVNCRTGSWGAEFYGVAPQAGDRVVIKHRYSAFAGTDLDVVLRTAGITSLLLTGVATDVCVESTLREGLFHEYHVTMVEDCCATYDPAAQEASVRGVEKHFGVVTTAGALSAGWAAVRQPA